MPSLAALRHPAELEDETARLRMAGLVLRRWKVNVGRIYAIDVDRIAFIDRSGRARTALLAGEVGAEPRVAGVVIGWPVG